ncbi:MAG: glycosyltransferase family 2 protein [Sedimenticola sp.]
MKLETGPTTDNERASPLVTIITAVFNNASSVEDSLRSVLSQSYPNIEYIVVDGGSTDGTVDVVRGYQDEIDRFVSEPDEGIYDALNKGIRMSEGDVIGILHSDDLFCDENVVQDVMDRITSSEADICFSDLVIVDKSSNKIVRYYMAHYFRRWLFRCGWMPPHPTCFIKRELYERFGLYTTRFSVAGDFDFLVRVFFGADIKWAYLDRVTVKMHVGGISNSGFASKRTIANEISASLRDNNVWSLSFFQVIRYLIRLFEFVVKPRNMRCG